jgi:hypothetical protein
MNLETTMWRSDSAFDSVFNDRHRDTPQFSHSLGEVDFSLLAAEAIEEDDYRRLVLVREYAREHGETVTGYQGDTLLHIAARSGAVGCIAALTRDPDVSLTALNADGLTPRQVARDLARRGAVAVLREVARERVRAAMEALRRRPKLPTTPRRKVAKKPTKPAWLAMVEQALASQEAA